MKKAAILVSSILALGFVSAAQANPVPKPSRDYAGNYKTLVEDQKATPQVARCVASGYDLASGGHDYDRLGFTEQDIAAAKVSGTNVSVSGQGRKKSDGITWVDITIQCTENADKLTAIEIVTGRP